MNKKVDLILAKDLALAYAKTKLSQGVPDEYFPVAQGHPQNIREMEYLYHEFEVALDYYISCGMPRAYVDRDNDF